MLGQELPALVGDGYTSFKVFMTYEDLALGHRELLEVLAVARETGALVMVHAENYDAIRFLTDRLERAGKTAPHHHASSRPIPVEREATHRAITLAELVDVPIMIVHVSNGEAMEQIRWAQSRGLKVFGETCPQYLVLTERTWTASTWRAPSTCAARRRATRRARRRAGWGWRRACSRSSHPTTARSAMTVRRASSRRRGARASAGCRTAFPASRPACRSCSPKAWRRGASPQPVRGAHLDQSRQDLWPTSAKGTIAVGADADIASGTRVAG